MGVGQLMIQEAVTRKMLQVGKVPGVSSVADAFTKHLSGVDLRKAAEKLGVIDVTGYAEENDVAARISVMAVNTTLTWEPCDVNMPKQGDADAAWHAVHGDA